MKYAMGFGAAIVLGLIVFVGVIFTGAYNVAASQPHTALGTWIFDTAMRRSVQVRATDAPRAQFTSQQIEGGFREYDSECVMCHGAPGVQPTAWARGLRPQPPDLSREVPEWSASELHWIVRNGIRMSAMPAMGAHHSDEDLWKIVAFLQTLPEVSPEEYQRMKARASQAAHGTHTH